MNDLEFKHWVIIGIILFAALSAASISIYQYVDGVIKEKKNENLQEKLIQTQTDLVNLQNETLKKVIGFGYAIVRIELQDKNQLNFYIQSKSDYPIYETGITVYDQDKINDCEKKLIEGNENISLNCYEDSGNKFPLFLLNAGKFRPLNFKKEISLNSERLFIIKIISKHSTTLQYSIIKFKKGSTKLVHYYRVFECLKSNYTLLEKDNLDSSEDDFANKFTYKKDLLLYLD